MDSQPQERCDNCLKDFPESKMATHYGYCRRNIKKCPTCNEMFDINFKDQHEEQYHRKEKCPHCSKEFPSSDYKDHEKKCDLKPKFCEYCELNVPVAGFSTHFKACESRTKPCSKCNKPIMNKDYLIHFVSCDGIVEQPRQPASYQEHIMQQQKKREDQYLQNQIDRVSSREKPSIPVVKPKEERIYAGIINKNGGDQRVVYEPRIINPPRPELEKKESNKQSNKYIPTRQEYKQESSNPPKRMVSNQLPPPSFNQVKRQEPKAIGIRPPIASNNEPKRSSGSREVPRAQLSSKEPTPVYQYQANKYSVKDSKSIERNGSIKREQDTRNKYSNQNINPRVEEIKRPINKIAPPRPKEEVARKKSPQPKIENPMQQFSMADLGLTPEQQMLQEILMQSANEHKPKTRPTIPSKPAPKNSEIPYMQGQDFMNESFLEKQKAIEQQLQRQRKGRR